ncbi:hypothetical protein TSAR_013845 [Trichomalopsis sarcophagae]|uniref:Uncharacterized protein n=1 Tax=Trichomalopsis sarcophagae TaxID=543379 RepID=A0A232EDX6_9HYME|nr:hypothetical protein TSAR_013845 [Trichomalopsis sarcophagae]
MDVIMEVIFSAPKLQNVLDEISRCGVDHRWINIRKSFARDTKNGKKFYLASDLQFLKKHIKHLENASCKSKPPKQSIKEEDNDEFHPEADDENLKFQDVLRCQLQSKQQTNVSQNSITKNENDSLLLNSNQNDEVIKPQENISAFTLALSKIQNPKSDCSSTPKNNVLTGITQSSKKPATSTVHAVMTKETTEITVPEQDEFAKRKQAETKINLQNKVSKKKIMMNSAADDENLNFQDVLRCQLQSKHTNVSQNLITKNENDSL